MEKFKKQFESIYLPILKTQRVREKNLNYQCSREREKHRANRSVQMGGSGASWVNPPQISTVLWSYSLPSALCSRCSHVCETKEKKVIIRFFLFWRETKVFYFNAAALSDFFFFFLIMLMCKTLELKQKVKCQECVLVYFGCDRFM